MPAASLLFGRESELDVLDRLLDDVHDRGGSLAVTGGPSVGNSALLAEGRARASSFAPPGRRPSAHPRGTRSAHSTGIADRQMAADGLTNREIRQKLYLSHRTIGSHLYRVFPPAGITSRAELRHVLKRGIPAALSSSASYRDEG